MSQVERISPNLNEMAPSRDVSMYGAKRWLWLLGFVPPAMPFLGFLLVQATGLHIFWHFGILFVYGFVAVIDIFIGVDRASFKLSELQAVEGQPSTSGKSTARRTGSRRVVYCHITYQVPGCVWH